MLVFTFLVITLLSMILFYYGTGKDNRVLVFSLLWISVAGIIAYTGYVENTSVMPPRFMIVVLAAVCLAVYFYRNVDRDKMNNNFLIAIHIIRLPVELVLYRLFLLKQIPVTMTFKGWNFDILMGVSAIFILSYLAITNRGLPKYFMLFWNITGLILLTTIVAIAILSAPLPIQQLAFEQPNVAVLQFPFVLLPAYIVPIVFLSHILAIGALMKK